MFGNCIQKSDDSVLFHIILARIEVEGDTLILTDIMGDARQVKGSLLMVDLANSIVKVNCED